MSGDLLEQATRALREASAEPQPRSGLTRARVLESAEKRYAARRLGLLRWVLALVAALAASTALARVAQYWPEIKRAIAPDSAEHRGAAPAQEKQHAAKPAAGSSPQLAAAGAAAHDVPGVQAAPPASPDADAVVVRDETRVPSVAPAPRRVKSSARRTKVVAREQTAPVAETEPVAEVAPAPVPTQAPVAVLAPPPEAQSAELALFRRAQRLHLNHDPKALAAWDDYLRVAGKGALAPEASYNRALCLVRLGRKSDARAALIPFANGEYGSYRRAEAKSLIDALETRE
jgi:hypothetical protein